MANCPLRTGELLDAVEVASDLGDKDVPARVHGHAHGAIELPRPRPVAAPHREEGAHPVELLDAVVPSVGDVDVPAPVHGHAPGVFELARPAALAAPGRQEGAIRVELLDAVVVVV